MAIVKPFVMPEEAEKRQKELARVLLKRGLLPDQVRRDLAEKEIKRRSEPKIITRERLAEATAVLEKYRRGKKNLDERVIENELWFRQQHWSRLRPDDKIYIPASGWVFNSLVNKHADIMDNLPECTCLAQESSDAGTAKELTSILPVVLEQNDFELRFSTAAWQKIKTGTAVWGVFWNPEKQNGLGDIELRTVDLLNIFWEPGINDIQRSKNVFTVELTDNETLISLYPQLEDKLSTPSVDTARYVYDDDIDVSGKSAVIDWYYKKQVNGKTVLCYVKYVNDTVLYSSEDDGNGEGYYSHGKYPFVIDSLFPEKGTVAGFGYIDVMKDNAVTIDRLNAIIVRNAEQGAMRRYFTRSDTSINMDEFTDWTNPLIHVTNGNLGEDTLREYSPAELSDVYVAILQAKIDELKETSSNRDFSQGSTAAGVTSGAAISALQEAGSKTSRDIISGSYRAFAEICKMMIELIRQFYSAPRSFRITGEGGKQEYSAFDNSSLLPGKMDDPSGIGLGERLPVFDIKVKAHKANPFSKAAQNQDAVNFFSMGFFNPAVADQALACLQMMDVDNKDKLIGIITENSASFALLARLRQKSAELAAELDSKTGSERLKELEAEGLLGEVPGADLRVKVPERVRKGFSAAKEHKTVKRAKERTRLASSVR